MSIEDATVLSAAAQKVMRDRLSVRQTEELVNHLVWLGPVSEKENRERHKQVEDPEREGGADGPGSNGWAAG